MGRVRPGDVLADRFELEREAGVGGMGTVFRALDRVDGGPVAVKVLNERHDAFVKRFVREAAVLAELHHPGIVRYVDHGTTTDGDHFLALEWLEGHGLNRLLRRGPLGIHGSVTLTRRVASALGAAHDKGILHRDIKLSNLFLPDDDPAQVRVLDFGIARDARRTVELTATGALIGTLAYMAPEQASGEKGLDARVDIYSLGVVLYECLTGSRAFLSEDTTAGLARILLEPPPRVRKKAPKVPAALDDLVYRMMAKERDVRPVDGHAVVELLDALETEATRAGSVAPTPTVLTTAERRMVWMLFVGRMADAAPTAESGGRARVRELTATLRRLVDEQQGRLEVLADGRAVALFDGAGTGTDRLEHAARCALAIRDAHPQLTLALSVGTTVGDRLEIRDAIERGAAALAHARAGTVRLEEGAEGLLGRSFRVDRDRHGAILRGRLDDARARHAVLGRRTPFVGRYREIASLEAIYAECISEPMASAAIVTSPPGIGKTRLCDELVGRLRAHEEPPLVLRGRSDSIGAGSPFGMLAHALRSAAGVVDGEAEEDARARLEAFVFEAFGRRDAAVLRVRAFLGELARVQFPLDASPALAEAREDPRFMGDAIRGAWLELLEAVCREQPVLVVLDDVHWGDRPSVELVDAALRHLSDRPLMALAFGRPGVSDRFPSLWSDRHPQHIPLAPLTAKAAEKLVRAVLGDDAEAGLVRSIVERSDGNSLFVEELLRSVVQGAAGGLPESLLAVVQSRLDDLDADTRRVLRAASVFGQRFWADGVAALLADQDAKAIGSYLVVLEQRELVERREPSSLSGQSELRFRHALVRDAAYAMLTEDDRGPVHRVAGHWLEEAGESDPVVLADHFARGGVDDRAREHFLRGAHQALDGDDPREARRRVERGLACGAAGEERGLFKVVELDALCWTGEYEAAVPVGFEALELLPERSPRWYHAVAETTQALAMRGRYGEIAQFADSVREPPSPEVADVQLVALCRVAWLIHQSGDTERADALLDEAGAAIDATPETSPRARGSYHAARAMLAFYGGDLSSYVAESERAVQELTRAGDERRANAQRTNVGVGYSSLGEYALGRELLRDSMTVAGRLGMKRNVAMSAQNLTASLMDDDLDEAWVVAQAAVDLSSELDSSIAEGAALLMRAEVASRRGDHDAARADAGAGLAMLAPVPVRLADAHGVLARALFRAGEPFAAVEHAEKALEIGREVDLGPGALPVLRVYAEALAASDREDEAHAAIVLAVQTLAEAAAKIAEPRYRTSFCERVHEHARILELARRWDISSV